MTCVPPAIWQRSLGSLRDQGKTILVITHQAAVMQNVADAMVHMAAGQIVSTTLVPLGSPANPLTVRTPVTTLSMTRATLSKDLRMEWRSKDAINSMLFFALLVVVIFSFAFNPTAEESRRIAGGLIWVAFLFAAVVALNQTWARELRNQVLDAYRVSPAPANALFLAKVFGNFLFVSVLEALMAPLFVVFYNLRSVGPPWQLVVGRAAGYVGAGGERNIFRSAVDSHSQSRDHAAADSLPDFHPRAAGDGGCHHVDSDRRCVSRLLDENAAGLRCCVHVRLSSSF